MLFVVVVMCGPEELITAFMLVALDKDMTMGDYVYIITYLFKPENLAEPWIVNGQTNEQTKDAYKPVLQVRRSSLFQLIDAIWIKGKRMLGYRLENKNLQLTLW